MIETDQQRRWWFATHPEYSHRSTGRRGKQGAKDGNSDKLDPEKVDSWADHRLKYEKDPVVIELIKGAKRWFGTAGKNQTPPDSEEGPRPTRLAAVFTADDAAMMMRLPPGAGGSSSIITPGFRPPFAGGGSSPSGSPMKPPTVPVKTPGPPPKPPTGGEGGPGKWVEVRRGKYGLEHQSKMSGQTIRVDGKKNFIHEYDVGGVKFDDFRDGTLLEYKGNYSNFIMKRLNEFYHWFKGADAAREQAWRQIHAAKGIPVIWRVGPEHQIEAFEKALGKIPGVMIIP